MSLWNPRKKLNQPPGYRHIQSYEQATRTHVERCADAALANAKDERSLPASKKPISRS